MAHAAVGWALCFATIGIGMAVTTERNALIIHAVGAPVFFAAVSAHYFVRYGYTAPLVTAVTFTGFVVVVDFLLVALVLLRSVEMFTSPLGTWIPFALIFVSTWATGRYLTWWRASPPGSTGGPARSATSAKDGEGPQGDRVPRLSGLDQLPVSSDRGLPPLAWRPRIGRKEPSGTTSRVFGPCHTPESRCTGVVGPEGAPIGAGHDIRVGTIDKGQQ